MNWPTYIRPWYMRIPFLFYEWLVMRAPLFVVRHWANRRSMLLVDRYGPFAPGRGYWQVRYEPDGTRVFERSPGMPEL